MNAKERKAIAATASKNIRDFFTWKLALDAGVPFDTIGWTKWERTKEGWAGHCKIDAHGYRPTFFSFVGTTKGWKFTRA